MGDEERTERAGLIGIIGWVVILALFLVWEGVALVKPEASWPTLSDFVRTIMRYEVGRWILFGLWLWLGWHFFIRGWRFFLGS